MGEVLSNLPEESVAVRMRGFWLVWGNTFAAAGRVLFSAFLLLAVPAVVEALAAARLTPADWRYVALLAVVAYLGARFARGAFRLDIPVRAGGAVARAAVVQEANTDGDLLKARHEAAHAVVARGLGFRVNLVTIEPDSATRSGGRNEVDWNSRGPRSAVDALFDLMIVCIASAIAEQDQLAVAAQYDVGPSEDVTRAVAAAARIVAIGCAPTAHQGSLTVDQLLAQASDRARSLLDEHAVDVDAVASALLKERTLELARVNDLTRAAE